MTSNLQLGKLDLLNHMTASAMSKADQHQPTPKRPSKRQIILEAALELYADAGFRGTSLKAIGARAGVTHAAVLYHFGSAVGILQAAIEERDQLFTQRYAQVEGSAVVQALARIPEVARFNVEHHDTARLHTVLAVESIDPNSPIHDWFRQRSRVVQRRYAKLLKRGMASGELRADLDPEQEASGIVAFMEGAQMQYLLDPQRADLVALYESYSARLIRDLSL